MSQNLWFGYKHRRVQLNTSQQRVYDLIYDGLKSCSHRILLKKDTSVDFSALFKSVLYDNPMLFHVEKFSVLSSINQIIVEPKYRFSSARYYQLVSQVEKNVSELVNVIKGNGNWNTIDLLHDYIVDTFIYDELGSDSHSVVGPAITKIGVCEGISKYVKLVCDALCIKCVVISGKAATPGVILSNSDNHSWNAICLMGEWFYFDFTFDLSLTGGSLNPGARRYDYYAIDRHSILADHSNPDIIVKPEGRNRDYFLQHHLIANNQIDFSSIVNRTLNSGVFEMSIKISDDWKNFEIQKAISNVLTLQNKSVSYALNESQMVCFLKFD